MGGYIVPIICDAFDPIRTSAANFAVLHNPPAAVL